MTVLDLRKYRIIEHILAMTQEDAIADIEQSVGLPSFDVSSATAMHDGGKSSQSFASLIKKSAQDEPSPSLEKKEKFWEAIKPIRKAVSIEEMIEEQNYVPMDEETMYSRVSELEIEEPLEDLLATLD
ncbi:MAG: hypothetical protein AAGG68_07595 [Bacteroidota bacterium]